MSVSGKRVFLVIAAFVLMTATILSAYSRHVYAATPGQITSRSLTLQAGDTDANSDGVPDYGGSMPSGIVNHLFIFTIPAADVGTAIGSIKFQYCTTADINIGGACTKPAGLDTTAATLGSEGANDTGFTLNTTTNGTPFLSKAGGATVPSGAQLSYQLKGITNPDGTDCATENCTFFVRISTYAETDPITGSPTPIDAGTVAASTSTQIVLTGTMPESLIFCTGATVDANCTTATSGAVTFNQLFSPTDTAFATSQMAASTNAGNGYAITVNGPTMTSGGNTITAIGATPAASTPGTRQFGMNLAANTGAYSGGGDPNITNSAYVTPAADSGDYMGSATANFKIGDPALGGADQQSKFAFNDTTANIVAKSDNSDNGGSTPGPTNSQVYTASYIVNVSGNLPAGTYTTTLTYICTPTF